MWYRSPFLALAFLAFILKMFHNPSLSWWWISGPIFAWAFFLALYFVFRAMEEIEKGGPR